VDPALITVVKGRPTAEELAALVSVLVAVTASGPAARGPDGRAWRASGLCDRTWQGPVAWSRGPRRWAAAR
jgi:Acyl-CoA carboxylase epsilon subunit